MEQPENVRENNSSLPLFPLFVGGLLSLIALILSLYGNRSVQHYALLSSLSAALLYTCALFLPYRYSLLTFFVFAAGFFLTPIQPITSMRIMIFSLALAGITRVRKTVPPFIILSSLWFLFLLITVTIKSFGFVFIRNELLVPKVESIIVSLLTESVAILALGLLLFSKQLNQVFGRRTSGFSSRVYYVHVIALTVILSLSILGAALLYSQGNLPRNAISLFLQHQPASSIIVCGLMLLPIIIGLFLATSIDDVSKALIAASDENSLHYTNQKSTMFSEVRTAYRAVQTNVLKQTAKVREAEEHARAIRLELKGKEKELYEQLTGAHNLVKLTQALPLGAISCSTSGAIVSINDEALRILELPATSLVGKHISVLDVGHPWQNDVVTFLSQGCRDFQRLLSSGFSKQFSSPIGYHYLECTLRIHSSSLRESRSQQLIATDTLVMLFFRRIPDLRDFLLRLLAPTTLEIIGSQAIELSKLLRNQLSSVVGNISIVNRVLGKLNTSGEHPLQQTEAGMELSVAVRNIDDIARSASAELKDFEERQAAQAEDIVRVNITQSFDLLLRFFQELLMPYQTTKIHFINDAEKTSSIESLPPAPGNSGDGDLIISVPESEVTKMYAYCLSLLKSLMTKTSDIYFSIGQETIESEMVHIIPGSHPGQYARIIIRHGGQSLTANMMTGKYNRARQTNRDFSETEQALALLQLQTTKLGGFITVQSTVSKGTFITIYLPMTRGETKHHLRPHKSQKHFIRKALTEEGITTNDVLLVGADEHTLSTVDTMLRHLGYDVHVQQTPLLLDEMNAPIDFMGSGFNPTVDLSQEQFKPSEKRPFHMIVVNIESPSRQLLNLIHHLERQNPHSSVLLIVEQTDEIRELFSDWATITKPFDIDTLTSAIKEAHARN